MREGGSLPFLRTLLLQLPSWWIWALLTPPILRLATFRPIGRSGWLRPMAFHLGTGSAAVLTYIALQAPFAILREGRTLTAQGWIEAVGGGLLFQYLTQLLIYFGILGTGHALMFRTEAIEREHRARRLESELQDARLSAMRARLQPHFLFNTLHLAGGLVREGRRSEAIGTLTGLSSLLRFTLDEFDAPEVALHQEMEALEQYLAIQELRFEDRLRVHRRIESDVADRSVPALILQPLVENALQHGPGGELRDLSVRIWARDDAGTLELGVEDDGVGLPAAFSPEADGGLGLRLTRERLDTLYGDRHTFTISPVPTGGTRATIRLAARAGATP